MNSLWLIHDERNLVRVLARDGAKHAKGRRDGVAAALNRQLDDVFGIEVRRVGRERCAGGMFDALVDGKNRHVAGAGQASGVEDRLERRKHAHGTIRDEMHPLDEIGTGQMERLLRNRLALMLEKRRVASEDRLNARTPGNAPFKSAD